MATKVFQPRQAPAFFVVKQHHNGRLLLLLLAFRHRLYCEVAVLEDSILLLFLFVSSVLTGAAAFFLLVDYVVAFESLESFRMSCRMGSS